MVLGIAILKILSLYCRNQANEKCIDDVGVRLLITAEERYGYGWGKSRKSPMMPDWNWNVSVIHGLYI